ncbi:MAG: hypothetical protein WD038_02790 [Balneolales bacterium]
MPTIKQIFREITPPVIVKTVRRIYPPPREDQSLKKDIVILKYKPESLAYYIGEPAFLVPISKIRYPGGIRYDYKSHHFIQYYTDGISALFHYYRNHQPKNIFEKHFLPTPANFDSQLIENIKTWHLIVPWLFNQDQEVQKGEKGLELKHGYQYHGPVSNQKVELEASRLDSVLESIKRNGFKPETFSGYPSGYFLIDLKGEWVFLIREGMHRVAALAHLGYKSIPVQFKENYPRIINQSGCSEWPMLKKGYLSKSEVSDIFMHYMKGVSVPRYERRDWEKVV